MKQYLDFFSQNEKTINSFSPQILNRARKSAFSAISKNEISAENKEWYRFFDLENAFAGEWGLNPNRLKSAFDPTKEFCCHVPGLACRTAYMLADFLHTQMLELGSGAFLCAISYAQKNFPELLEKCFSAQKIANPDNAISLNQLLAQDGFFFYVPEGVALDEPVQIAQIMHGLQPLFALSNSLIFLEKNASAKFLICDHAATETPFTTNRIVSVFLAENSSLELLCLESTHALGNALNSIFVHQSKNSNFKFHQVNILGGKTRNSLRLDLAGAGANAELFGLCIGAGEQFVDNSTQINHLAQNCTSRQLFKYVLDENAVGNFFGKIFVSQSAPQTQAFQTARSVALSDNARLTSRPQLEIYNDEVVCNHGATSGSLDENALFYLRSRGLPLETARLMLLEAFIDDILQHVSLENLRQHLTLLASARLRGEAHRCKGCQLK